LHVAKLDGATCTQLLFFQAIVRLGNVCSYNDFKQNIEDLKTKTLEVISPEVKSDAEYVSILYYSTY